METLLETLGVVALAFLALLVLAALVAAILWWRLRRWIGAKSLESQPTAIGLVPSAPGRWADPERSAEWAEELEEMGWRPAGELDVRELPGVRVGLWSSPDGRAAGAICQHPASRSPWLDLWCLAESGSELTVTSNPQAGLLEQPPWRTTVRREGESAAELERTLEARAPADRVVFRTSDLPRLFEEAWEREMRWRKGKGVSPREVDAVARRMREEDR